jgi:hypothetical protein
LLDVAPERLRNLPFHVALYRWDVSEEGRSAGDAQISAVSSSSDSSGLVKHLSYFEDWPDLPTDSLLLCFRYGPRFGLTVEGACKRIPELDTAYEYESRTYEVQLVVVQESMLGLEYSYRDAQELVRRLKPSVRELCANARDDEGLVMSLYDVLMHIGPT